MMMQNNKKELKLMLVFISVLVLAVSVSAQQLQITCGDGEVGTSEECEFDNQCGFNEVCNECSCETPELTFTQAKFDLEIVHNLMFNKVIQLLHIIKDQLFQLEFKTIDMQLTNQECTSMPVSFWMSQEYYPYGKLGEINEMLAMIINSWDKIQEEGNLETAFGPDASSRLSEAKEKLDYAVTYESASLFRQAFECKCIAAKKLSNSNNVGAVECPPPTR